MCRHQVKEKERETKGMESDFILSQLGRLEVVKKQLKKEIGTLETFEIEQCDVCKPSDDQQDAVYRCLNCKKNLCEDHHEIHNNLFHDHVVVDISEVDEIDQHQHRHRDQHQESSKHEFGLCFSHTNERKVLFCLRCNQTMCFLCFFKGNHKGHEFESLQTILKRKKNRLLVLSKDVENRRQDIEQKLELIGMMETKIQATSLDQKDQISIHFQRIEEEIKKRRQILIKRLEEKSKEKIDRLTLQRKQLERDLECSDNSISFSRSLVRNGSNDQIMSHFPIIFDQLSRLKNDKSFDQSPVEINFLEIVSVDGKVDLSAQLDRIQVVEKPSEEMKRMCERSNDSPFSKLGFIPRDYRSIESPFLLFGSQGSNSGEFERPNSVAIDHRNNNNIIVCDSNNNRIQVFDEHGIHLFSFGSQGSSSGKFEGPQAVSVDLYNSHIVVCDTRNNRIQVFDERGNHIKSFGSSGMGFGQFYGPRGLAIDHNNNIGVSDTTNHRIQVFDMNGIHLKSFGSFGSTDGKLNRPLGISIDHNNNIIVCDSLNHRIQVFDENGVYLKSFGAEGRSYGLFDLPVGVAVDHHNNVVVCDNGNHRIQVFDDRGIHLKSFGSQGSQKRHFYLPTDVFVDSHNNLIVCDGGNHRILAY